MGRCYIIFEFKCSKGHLKEERFPPGTGYSEHPSIACPKCLESGELNDAYITFAYPEDMSHRKVPEWKKKE